MKRVAVLVLLVVAQIVPATEAFAETDYVTVVIVRHAETSEEPPTFPLTSVGRRRAELLVPTLHGLKLTNIFATHTTRARQTVEPVAADQQLQVVQLPAPGSRLNGQPVSDATPRQVAIEPIADAVLKLPAGSVALIGANSDNIYGILHRLGVPLPAAGRECAVGSTCVPCLEKTCFPVNDFDHLWYLVIEAGRAQPIVMIETRYGAGWIPAKD